MLFTADWDGPEGPVRGRPLVARIAPTGHTVFLDPDFVGQARVMRAMAEHAAAPLPPVLGIEEDGALLGAPFVVMDRIDGVVPTDNPPFAAGGWLADAAPQDQERLWWSGIEAMAAVHRTDWGALGLGFLRPARPGGDRDRAGALVLPGLPGLGHRGPAQSGGRRRRWPGSGPTGRRSGAEGPCCGATAGWAT